jgi:cytoskeletal protein RodZ
VVLHWCSMRVQQRLERDQIVASISSVLQLEQLRRKAGVSLEAISDQTKISTSYLRAIESEEFDKLPGGVFDTNFIRQYACAIGFSEKRLLEQYVIKTTPEPQPEIEQLGFFRTLRLKMSFWRPVHSRPQQSLTSSTPSGRAH